MMISVIAGIVFVLIVLAIAAYVLFRRYITPPIEVERALSGIELDARRGALHDLFVTVNDRPAIMIEMVPAGATLVPWSTLGIDDPAARDLQQVSITGRTGNRFFQTTISFGRNETPPSEYASQTWRYVDNIHSDDEIVSPSMNQAT